MLVGLTLKCLRVCACVVLLLLCVCFLFFVFCFLFFVFFFGCLCLSLHTASCKAVKNLTRVSPFFIQPGTSA